MARMMARTRRRRRQGHIIIIITLVILSISCCCCLSSWRHRQGDGEGDESSLRVRVRVRARSMARGQGHIVIIKRVRVRARHHWRDDATTYHKWTPLLKAMGPLTGAGMTGTSKNRQFGYPYLYPHLTCTRTRADYPNPCSCLETPS